MAIFSRLADILKANINDMIDKAEDPVKMVKQLIIEMEEQVDDATQALGQAMGSQKVAAKELAEAEAKVADWNDKAKLALKNGKEDLARRALDVKVGLDPQVAQLRASYDEITAQVDKLKNQVQTLRMKLDEARARQNVLIARSKMAVPSPSTPRASTPRSRSSTASRPRSSSRSPRPRPLPRSTPAPAASRTTSRTWPTTQPSTPSSSA